MEERTITCNVAAITDVGMVRKNNEDNLIVADLHQGCSLPASYNSIEHQHHEHSLLLVVSDGMGGAQCGEVASELTVLSIKDVLMKLPRTVSAHDRIVAAVEEANHIVWNEGRSNPAFNGMGATVTAALIDGDQAYIAEVGDSRAYLIRSGNIKQVTTDQSFVAQLIQKGLLRPEDAVQHPRKNVILQSIGTQEVVQVAVSMFELKRGDTILLCSDGLSNYIDTAEMLFFCDTRTPAEAAQKLIDIAKERGGQDNITVVVAHFDGNGLGECREVKGLTGMLQTLSTYDPDQEVEKSHKRTQLLGNSSLGSKYYGNPGESQPKVQVVTNLSGFPNSGVVKQECERLIEWLDYCQQVLQIKTHQIEQAADWMEGQGAYFVNLTDTLDQIEHGVGDISRAKETVAKLLQLFESN